MPASIGMASKGTKRQKILRLILLLISSTATAAILSMPLAMRSTSFSINLRDVANQDIRAPGPLTFTSTVLTDRARDSAEKSIQPIFLPADPSINRQQIEKLRLALEYMTTIRNDAYSPLEKKIQDIRKITGLVLSDSSQSQVLAISESRWLGVYNEALLSLEQVMRGTVREDRLEETLRTIPSRVSIAVPEDLAPIVVELVSSYLAPNSIYSSELTLEAVQAARNEVQPVNQSFAAGETIVSRGQIIDDVRWEALQQYGLIKENTVQEDILGILALVALLGVFVGLYMQRRPKYPLDDLRSLALIAVLFTVFLFGARLIIPNRTVLPYIYPLSAFGLTIAVLFSAELGLILSVAMSILAAYGLSNSIDISLYYLFGSLLGILALGKARRVINFFWAGVASGVAGSAVILAYRLPADQTDLIGIATLVGASLFSGLAAASLTLLLQFLFAQLLGLTTALQLLEISRPDHPLLQYLLRNAPGTYQHSLQVANLAEQAAEAIGADALLTRVGALYHDVGKALNPLFFVENQVSGEINPHDDLDPFSSSETIIQHVHHGLQLARKHHLPPGVQAFISEHHGSLVTRYQYTRAVEASRGNSVQVDLDRFRYPGPSPTSRETALLMLADGSEARARAELPKDEAALRETVMSVFEYCERDGQLNNTKLTLQDLHIAFESFIKTLSGIHHPRLVYPEIRAVAAETPLLKSESPDTQVSISDAAGAELIR